MTQPRIEPRQGEIYYIQPNPATGHEYQKNRPVVVISGNQVLKKSSLIAVMAITASGVPLKEDIFLQKNNVNNLSFDSVIKVEHITSLDRRRILRYIGEVDRETMTKIKEYLKDHFDL